MLNRVLVFWIFVGLATTPAIADPPSTLSAEKLASIKSIGVISAVADTVNISTNGPFLRLSMSHKARSISYLGIDGALEGHVAQRLGARFKIEPVHFDREVFSKVEDGVYLNEALLPSLENLIKSLSEPVDAYLVISKDIVPFGLDPKTTRPGLNIGRGGFHEDQYVADAFIIVSVVDASNSVVLARVVYPPPISRIWGGQVERLPFDGALWPDDAGNFTSQQDLELKKFFTENLDAIVEKSITRLGLLPGHQ